VFASKQIKELKSKESGVKLKTPGVMQNITHTSL
jgi:hypothetical protein